MIDLSQISIFLASLGPWGLLAAGLLGFFGPRLLARLRPKVDPSQPQPVDPAAPSNTPILDAVLRIIRERLKQRAAPVQSFQTLPEARPADISPEEAADLLNRF